MSDFVNFLLQCRKNLDLLQRSI